MVIVSPVVFTFAVDVGTTDVEEARVSFVRAEPEDEDVPADHIITQEKASKSPVRRRAPKAQTARTRRR